MTRKKFTTTLDEGLIKRLKIVAIEQESSVSTILERLMRDYLNGNDDKLKK